MEIVSYLLADGSSAEVPGSYTLVAGSTSDVTWSSGIYVVGADYNGDGHIDYEDSQVAGQQTTFNFQNNNVTVTGNVLLIVADGFTLNLESSQIYLTEDSILTVSSQSLDKTKTGKLNITADNDCNAIIGIGAASTTLNIHAGNLSLKGGKGSNGNVGSKNPFGVGGDGGNGGDGAEGIVLTTVDVKNGFLTVQGGEGGDGGAGGWGISGSGNRGSDGNSGQAIDADTVTVNSSLTVKAGSTEIVSHTSDENIASQLQTECTTMGKVTDAAVNSNWANTTYGTTVEAGDASYILGLDAFATAAEALAMPSLQSLTYADGTYNSTVSGNAPSVTILDGEYKKILGGGIISEEKALNGDISLTIKDCELNNTTGGEKTYTGAVTCGDGVSQSVTVQRSGDLSLSISGGTFNGVVAGGMFYCPSDYSSGGSATLIGDVDFTITGGTFNSNIYGGSLGRNAALAANTTITGLVSLTVDATSQKITIDQNLVAGSMGKGRIIEGVEVTFKGYGNMLDFGASSVVFGGSSSDYARRVIGDKKIHISTNVGEMDSDGMPLDATDRKLVFDTFEGNFDAEIRLFGAAEFTNNSDVTFTNANIDLWSVEQWTFQAGSSASGLQINDFTEDTLILDLTDYDGKKWTVMSGTEDTFNGFGGFDSVSIDNITATYDKASNSYSASDDQYKYNLNLVDDDGEYSMVLTRTNC